MVGVWNSVLLPYHGFHDSGAFGLYRPTSVLARLGVE